MLDRASTFADPQVLALLRERFVPVALDVWYAQRREDAAGDYYRSVVLQRDGVSLERTTQGLYAFGADGVLLRGWNNRGAERALRYLSEALEEFTPRPADELERAEDARLARRPPAGGLVLDVHTRILEADWPDERDRWDPLFRASVGRDHLWVRADEARALARGVIPRSLLTRIARFHLVDDTRGEPPMWRPHELRALELEREEDGWWRGHAQLASEDGTRGYTAELLARLELADGAVTQFELVALGAFHGEGRWTSGAPPGEFQLGVALRLAGGDAASRAARGVPPQGSRDLDDYLGE